jgi:uncharacterized membrane protein
MQFFATLSNWAKGFGKQVEATVNAVGKASKEAINATLEKAKEIIPSDLKSFIKETIQRIKVANKEACYYVQLMLLAYAIAYLGYCFIATVMVFIPLFVLLMTAFIIYFLKGVFIGMVLTILLLEIDSLTKQNQ